MGSSIISTQLFDIQYPNLIQNFGIWPKILIPLGLTQLDWHPLENHIFDSLQQIFLKSLDFMGLVGPNHYYFNPLEVWKPSQYRNMVKKENFIFWIFWIFRVPIFKMAVEMVKMITASQNMARMAANELNFMNLGKKWEVKNFGSGYV